MMTPFSEIPDDLKDLNTSQVRNYDKYFRMGAGAATQLVKISDGIFELETSMSQRERPIPIGELVRKIAISWSKAGKTESCHTCRVRLYLTIRRGDLETPPETQTESRPPSQDKPVNNYIRRFIKEYTFPLPIPES